MKNSPSPKLIPHSRKIALVKASQLTGVSYDTFITAHRAGRLSLIKTGEGNLMIDLHELVTYLINDAPKKHRWKPEKVEVERIVTVPEMQPRFNGSDRCLISTLVYQQETGGKMPPIWLIPIAGKLAVADGHRRFASAKEAKREFVNAIILRLPAEYGEVIARISNQRHGVNLNSKEQRQFVVKYLKNAPEVLAAIASGKLTQAEFASEIDVSTATVSRALREMGEAPKAEPISFSKLFGYLTVVVGQQSKASAPPEKQAETALFVESVGKVMKTCFSSAQLQKAKTLLRAGEGHFGKILPIEAKKLIDRRGGDRSKRLT